MIAMQYGFTFPADYDMAIIDRRIAEKGHMMDGFPGLVFKSYLTQRRKPGQGNALAAENVYAPFYLWHTAEAMNAFLCSAGFAGLTQAFGWPSVKTWSVWDARSSAGISKARFATRESFPVTSYSMLEALRASEIEQADILARKEQALAVVTGFEPTTWTQVRFCLWDEPPAMTPTTGAQLYAVGHLSKG
jgi:hypothetical protein